MFLTEIWRNINAVDHHHHPKNVSFKQFLQNIDGFRQNKIFTRHLGLVQLL